MTSQQTFMGTVFIGASLDGFIARPDGEIDWLVSRGAQAGDMGYRAFMESVDTVVMGRATYEKVLTFGAENWPYEGKYVVVLSTRLGTDADDRVRVHRNLQQLVQDLADRGCKTVYADGGQVIQSFLRAGLLDEITINTAPVLIGSGLPLFGALDRDVELVHRSTSVFGGFVQITYTVRK